MADEKVTLSIKQVNGSSEVSSMNISYVNPDATDKQLHTFAEETLALSYDTLVSASRVETRELQANKLDRNFYFQVDGSTQHQTEVTYAYSALHLTDEYPCHAFYLFYEGDGVPYVKSHTTFASVSPICYTSSSSYPQVPVVQVSKSPEFSFVPADVRTSSFKYFKDKEHTQSTCAGDIVIALPETFNYYGAEVVIHITAD